MTLQSPIMDARSEACLTHIHPDLVKVIRAAKQSPQPFVVIHGIRTEAEECVNVAKGASQTMHSRHLPDAHGFACAIDFACLADGHVSWDAGLYAKAWGEIEAAAKALNVPVEWGGAWKTLKDWGHVQLPWGQYP